MRISELHRSYPSEFTLTKEVEKHKAEWKEVMDIAKRIRRIVDKVRKKCETLPDGDNQSLPEEILE